MFNDEEDSQRDIDIFQYTVASRIDISQDVRKPCKQASSASKRAKRIPLSRALTVAPSTVAPSTVAPTSTAPSTVAPSVVNQTQEDPKLVLVEYQVNTTTLWEPPKGKKVTIAAEHQDATLNGLKPFSFKSAYQDSTAQASR